MLDVIASLPAGTRSKDEIDRQLADDRAGWNGRADVYLDACCFIYLVEGQPGWRTVLETRLRGLDPTSSLITSQLARSSAARSQCVMEIKSSRALDALFGASRVAVLDVSSKVIDRATELRARYGFKSPMRFTWRRRSNTPRASFGRRTPG